MRKEIIDCLCGGTCQKIGLVGQGNRCWLLGKCISSGSYQYCKVLPFKSESETVQKIVFVCLQSRIRGN